MFLMSYDVTHLSFIESRNLESWEQDQNVSEQFDALPRQKLQFNDHDSGPESSAV